MKVTPVETKIVSQKLLAHISPEFRRVYQIPKEHDSVGMFSADNDDAAYLAVDDASKKTRIRVIRAETFYGGEGCAWSRYGGKVEVIFSGPRVEDVRSALAYINDFMERRSALYCFENDLSMAFYAQTMPRAGTYFKEAYGIPEGQAYTYLVAGPIEAGYALEKALKASRTTMRKFWEPPSHANSCGAILSGTESACRSAEKAFIEGLRTVQTDPLAL